MEQSRTSQSSNESMLPLLRQSVCAAIAVCLGVVCACPGAAAQSHPDGGPWAPVVIDMESVEVVPRHARPKEKVEVRFRCRGDHAAKITRLGLFTVPSLIEDTEATGLDVESGTFTCILPSERLKFAGTYELRLSLDFRWEDGKTYHRSPPFGTLTVHPFARHSYTKEAFAADLTAAGDAAGSAQAVVDGRGDAERFAPLFADISSALREAQERFRAGDHPDARKSIHKAVSLARFATGHTEKAACLLDIRRFLAENPAEREPCLTLMPGHGGITEADHELIRWLGTDTVVHSVPAQVAKLEAAGFRTAVSKAPARFSEQAVLRNKLHRQQRYLLSDPVRATASRLELAPLHGFVKGHFEPDVRDPHRYWRVYDTTSGSTVTVDSWNVAPDTGNVRIDPAFPGHEYRVATLVFCGDLPFFHTFAEPTFPDVQGMILRRMEGYLKQLPGLDVYRPTSLFYPFPKIEKYVTGHPTLTKANWHNFYGYQWGTSPEAQAAFERETDIPFDPAWIVDDGRYGDVNYPPQDAYVAWMRFQQRNVNKLTRQVADVAHRHGAKVRLFWGDHWIGAEPYLDFFHETGVDQIVKACNSSVVTRMTVDIPADVKKIIRFSPWFSWGELFRFPSPPGRLDTVWRDIKRAALFRTPDGLSWGGETLNIGLRDEALANKMRDITNEFRVIHALLNGREVFRHDLNVYIMNAWGKSRSWAAWLQVNECQQILTHLTDLPVNMRFISLAEIAGNGVPEDAHVLMNYGEPGSAWSGGRFWDDARLTDAVSDFVRNGGGLVGIGAPSHHRKGGQTWQLSHLLGVKYGGASSPDAAEGSFTKYDVIFLAKGTRSVTRPATVRTPSRHWITETSPDTIEPVLVHNWAKTIAEDVTVFCAQGDENRSPGLAVRHAGEGRTVYINGYSKGAEYGRILRRSLFWAAGRERDYRKVWAADPTVFTYVYPDASLLVVYNMSREGKTVAVALDVALLGLPRQAEISLVDKLSGREAATTSARELAAGIEIPVIGGGIRFLDVRARNALTDRSDMP